jgi:hypothetical protein
MKRDFKIGDRITCPKWRDMIWIILTEPEYYMTVQADDFMQFYAFYEGTGEVVFWRYHVFLTSKID